MTIQRVPALVLLMAGLIGVTACRGETAADKPAAPAVTFKPVPPAGTAAPASSAPLVGARARDAHGLEPGEAHVRLVTRHARKSGIDDDAHAVDGQ